MRTFLLAVAFASSLSSPVGKVVTTLQAMQTQLSKEQKEDTEAYEKMQCWCETNDKEKTAAVAAAKKSIDELTAAIETGTAKSSELKSTLKKLDKSVKKNTEALKSATGLRENEASEFDEEEADLSSSLDSATAAVDALSKQNGFLQGAKPSAESLLQIKAGVRASLLRGTEHLSEHQQMMMHDFLQQPADFQSYNSRSGAIFGVLGSMKDTFTADLSQARKDESLAVSDYEALAAAKNDEISAAKKMTVDKTQELATTNEDLANAKHDKELTIKRLNSDEAFLMDLADKCAEESSAYDKRTKERSVEIKAVGEAIAILNDDSARDLFTSTLSFAQIKAQSKSQRRQQAMKLLRATAKKSTMHAQALVEVAEAAKLDAFKEVIGMVDEMVGALKKEQEDEYKHQEFCAKELQENLASQKATEDTIADLTATIATLEADIDTLAKEIKDLEAEVVEMKIQVKKASEDRSAENKVFQQTVADQRMTQVLLKKALAKLAEVYAAPDTNETAAPASFVQLKINQPATPTYERSSSGGGVLDLMQGIITEAAMLETEATASEQDAQSAYVSFVTDTGKALEASQRSIAKKEEEKAEKESARLSAIASKKGAEKELMALKKYEAQLHTSCDYVMKNFEVRQEARSQEMDSLGQAKAILSGA
jgi:chromosome segregation ATPase